MIREDSTFEFYSEFNLVSFENKMQCLRVATDEDSILLQLKAAKQSITTNVIKQISFTWGNLIGMSVADHVEEFADD